MTATVVALLLLCGLRVLAAELVNLFAVHKPGEPACDSRYYQAVEPQPYVCEDLHGPGAPGSDASIVFEGPGQQWKKLPDNLVVNFSLPQNFTFNVNGPFQVIFTAAANRTDDAAPKETVISSLKQMQCTASIQGEPDVSSSQKCLWPILTSWDSVCRLQLGSKVYATHGGTSLSALQLQMTIPPAIQKLWAKQCGPGPHDFTWAERYYFSGFSSYHSCYPHVSCRPTVFDISPRSNITIGKNLDVAGHGT